jgi:N-hydroxyarylamine O-acetyltransferase
VACEADIDLDAYFRRIGYTGSRVPTLETLKAINFLHSQAIAFENLNPLMKWPVKLDASSLERKLVKDGRGGYCYEHNLLFAHVLRALGFQVKGLAGRVIRGLPLEAVTPRTHIILHIVLDGHAYIADVGYGIATLTAPLRLQLDTAQPTPHEPCRFIGVGDEFAMQVKVRDSWIALYRFDMQEQFLPDYEVSNWYTSSHFLTNLLVARAGKDCRHTLRNTSYAVHYLSGVSERRTIDRSAELRTLLERTFRITLPDGQDLDAALERIVLRAE